MSWTLSVQFNQYKYNETYLIPVCEVINVAQVLFLWGLALSVLDVASVEASLEFWGNPKQEKQKNMVS